MSKMTIERFQDIARELLKKHYGIGLSDTLLWDEDLIQQYLDQGTRPFEAVAEHAEETEIVRIDVTEAYGLPSHRLVTEADEEAVIQDLPIPSIEAARDNNDEVKAMSMYESFTQPGVCFKNMEETLARYYPSPRAEKWFRLMVEKGRSYVLPEEKATVLNDRYAERIIGDRHAEYDAIEIQGVRDLNLPGDPQGTCCEVNNDRPQFYSVYVHWTEGGVECVGDMETLALAKEYADELSAQYRWPIYNYTR